MSVPGRKEPTIVTEDEYPSNASGINDGAAVVILMTAEAAASRQLSPMGKIVSSAVADFILLSLGTGKKDV